MGTTSSVEAGPAEVHSGNRVGYRVLQVQPDSPGAESGLVSFFDFVIAANGVRLETETDAFMRMVQDAGELADRYDAAVAQHQAQTAAAVAAGAPAPAVSPPEPPPPLRLDIYNAKNNSMRVVDLRPRRWGGEGLLGLFIRFDTYVGSLSNVLFVLDVQPESPAARAGLRAEDDFILGGRDAAFSSVASFSTYVKRMAGRPRVRFYVYNAGTDTVRECVVDLSDASRGMGATVAHGKLHELPNTHTLGATAFAQDFGPAPYPPLPPSIDPSGEAASGVVGGFSDPFASPPPM